jgi:methyl-accepting chemotaxis protein
MKVLEKTRISAKIAGMMAVLGLLCILVAVHGGNELMSTDADYTVLTDQRAPAQMALAKANRVVNHMAFAASMIVFYDGSSRAAVQAKGAYVADFKALQELLKVAAEGLPTRAKQIDTLVQQAAGLKTALDAAVTAGMNNSKEEAAAAMVAAAQKVEAFSSVNRDTVDASIRDSKVASDGLTSNTQRTRWLLLITAALGTVGAVGASLWVASRGITRPLNRLESTMGRLAGGDLDVEVDGQTRSDEIGAMAKAVQIFKDNGLKAQTLASDTDRLRLEADDERGRGEAERRRNEAEQAMVVGTLATSLSKLAAGDLTTRIDAEFNGKYSQLKSDFNEAIASLREAMAAISGTTDRIRGGSDEIASASDELSLRTEQQAASLEETASALSEITSTVQLSAENAREASSAASNAKLDAEKSGQIMHEAVAAMTAIEQSSGQITRIIGVIDEIAFQTNLLALNAGVEAARAGDAGRGFAVVAQEVRALAQRSAEAAKEIKSLIATSSSQVGRGVSLVSTTGTMLADIVGKVGQIDVLISRIAHSSQEQATGLNQVSIAVNQIDQVTQQNSAMVEEATAAAASLRSEAGELANLMSRFQTGQAGARIETARPGRHAPAPNLVGRAQERLVAYARTGGSAQPVQSWEEF